MRQLDFEKRNWKYNYSHGGELRKKRAGRGARPLSSKDPLHLVLKANRDSVRGGLRSHQRFLLINQVLKRYSKRFFIKIEQVSVQVDHIHLLIRTSRRSNFQSFFRVLSGQIAQRFQNEGLMTFPNSRQDPRKNRNVTDTPAEGFAQAQDQLNGIENGNGESNGIGSSKDNRNGNGTSSGTKADAPKLWKHRPFSRVVKGFKAYKTMQAYIVLNELEVLGKISYQVLRLKGVPGLIGKFVALF